MEASTGAKGVVEEGAKRRIRSSSMDLAMNSPVVGDIVN